MTTEKYTTYMRVTLNSEGATPTEVTTVLKNLGWVPIIGPYDYCYKWTEITPFTDTSGIEPDLPNFDKVHQTLRGRNVQYSLVTYEYGTEDFTYWPKH